MYPERVGAASWIERPVAKEFVIQRMKAAPICSWQGTPPSPSWEKWREFDSAEERDTELAKLRKTTEWRLRPARQTVIDGRVWNITVEDEEWDLLARLALLRSSKLDEKS